MRLGLYEIRETLSSQGAYLVCRAASDDALLQGAEGRVQWEVADRLVVMERGEIVTEMRPQDMTVAELRRHGVVVDDSEPDRWHVAPGVVRAVDVTVEPDLSNAGPFLALAMVSAGTVTVRDWPASTTQAGDALREILTSMGGRVAYVDEGLRVTGPDRLEGIDQDLHDVGVGEPGRVEGLGPEAGDVRGLVREVGVEDLHGHGPLEADVGGGVDRVHAAAGQPLVDPVPAAVDGSPHEGIGALNAHSPRVSTRPA